MEPLSIGFSCKIHGDLAPGEYYISKGKPTSCKACVKIRTRARYVANKGAICKKQAEYRRDNLDKVKARAKRYNELNKEQLKQKQKDNYRNNSELYKKRIKEYQAANFEVVSSRKKAYYNANKPELAAQKKIYRAEHVDRIKYIKAKYAFELRTEAMLRYSAGTMICAFCSDSTFEHLCLDHINNDGCKHRNSLKKVCGKSVYLWVKMNGYPPIFQVLCYNCNFLKSLKSTEFPTKTKKYNTRIKYTVMSHYSGGEPSCAICLNTDLRVLTIDHINGGGRKHITSLGMKGGTHFYKYLRNNGYPEGLRVLCFNCNCKQFKPVSV
jgi:hypothetical protein